MLKTQFLTQYCRKFHVYFQYYVHFSRNSYFLIVVPHIFWVRIFIYKGTFAPLPPLLKGKGGDAPLRPPPLSGVPVKTQTYIEKLQCVALEHIRKIRTLQAREEIYYF
jgi:hypothetical protein